MDQPKWSVNSAGNPSVRTATFWPLRSMTLRCWLPLAPGAPAQMSIQELADQEKIPKKFLEQVLLALKNAGILHRLLYQPRWSNIHSAWYSSPYSSRYRRRM